MRFEELIAQCEQAALDPHLPLVRQWKAENRGRRAVGCFPVYTPRELIAAAGMLPVSLFGGGDRVEVDRADSRIQSFVCSIARSTLEMGLRGDLDCLDGMVFPSICDVARNLSGVWTRNFPDRLTFYLHLPQNVFSPAAEPYYCGELARLRSKLEELAGAPVANAALAASMAVSNKHRARTRRLEEYRQAHPDRLTTRELYLLCRMGATIPAEEHCVLLELALQALENRPAQKRDAVRVILESAFCEQPPLELIHTLEEAGCVILDDAFLQGLRWYAEPIPVNGDPLGALARAYLRSSPVSSVAFPGERNRGLALVERCQRLQADGVIFCCAKFCEPALYDYVLMKQALERAKIPYLQFEFEEKMTAFESVRLQIETFVESVLFFS